VAVGAIVASLLLLAYALLGNSDEDKILHRLKELASAVESKEGESFIFRTARLNAVFKDALEPNATLSAPELPTTSGAREIAALGGQSANFATDFRVSVGETDVRIDGKAARAVAVVTFTGSERGELRREKRHVRFLLNKSGSDWRVASIDVDARSEDQPEARP